VGAGRPWATSLGPGIPTPSAPSALTPPGTPARSTVHGGWGSQATAFPALSWCKAHGVVCGVGVPSVTSSMLTVFSSWACSFSQHKITQGEDFGGLLDDIKKALCRSDIMIMEGFCFTIPFIDLCLPLLDLQDDTLNRSVTVEQETTREMPNYKNRCPFDILDCFLGANGHLEVFSLGKVLLISAQAVVRAWEGTSIRHARGMGMVSSPSGGLTRFPSTMQCRCGDQCPSQMCSYSCWKIRRSSGLFTAPRPRHLLGLAEPGCPLGARPRARLCPPGLAPLFLP